MLKIEINLRYCTHFDTSILCRMNFTPVTCMLLSFHANPFFFSLCVCSFLLRGVRCWSQPCLPCDPDTTCLLPWLRGRSRFSGPTPGITFLWSNLRPSSCKTDQTAPTQLRRLSTVPLWPLKVP